MAACFPILSSHFLAIQSLDASSLMLILRTSDQRPRASTRVQAISVFVPDVTETG
jgi:hypothetical protein